MAWFNFKNKGKLFIFLAAVALISSLFISGCGQSPKDQAQLPLIDNQNSIATTDHNRRLFFKSSHEQIKFGYAVQSCFVKLGGNFLVDGYNSFCGEYNPNQNISTGSVAYVNDIKINGRNVRITGQVVRVQSCDVDVSQIIDRVRQSNNNSVIPSQFIRDGELKLENNNRLTLPSGVYYFKEIKVSGRGVLEFSGPTTIVVEGDVSVEGQGQIKTNPVFLRIISTGKVKVEGQGTIYGGIIGNEVKVDGKGQIFGGVISREFKGEGQGVVHFDKGLGLDRVEVFPSEVTIKVGETVQLTALAKDIFGNEISCVWFDWGSSDPSVAVVDQNGLVQGVGEGRAIISATAKKEGYNLAFKGEAIMNVIQAGPVECPLIWSKNIPGVFGAGKIVDLEGDGILEFIVGSGHPSGWGPFFGNIYILDTRTGNILSTINIPGAQAAGHVPVSVTDINNDGVKDIVANWGVFCCYGGTALIDGRTKSIIWQKWLGDRGYLTALLDINNDGVYEIMGGGGAYSIWYLLDIYGNLIWQIPFWGWTESRPAIGDVDGDGKLEIAITSGAWPPGVFYIFDAQTGATKFSMFLPRGSYSPPAMGDIDGDGKDEIVVVDGTQPPTTVRVVKNYSILWERTISYYGATIGGTPILSDLNNDGVLDVIVGASEPKTVVLDGLTGNIIWEVKNVFSYIIVTGDVNGDGIDDVITTDGYLYVFDGRNGNLICKSRENKAYLGVQVADIDSDGILEIIAGGGWGQEVSAYRGLGRFLRPPQWPQVGHDLLNSNNFRTKPIY
jgi:hypothetical protein